MLDGLLRPADLTRAVVLVHLTLRLATNTGDEATEGDGLLVLEDVLEVLLGIAESAALERIHGLTRVLKENSMNDGEMATKEQSKARAREIP